MIENVYKSGSFDFRIEESFLITNFEEKLFNGIKDCCGNQHQLAFLPCPQGRKISTVAFSRLLHGSYCFRDIYILAIPELGGKFHSKLKNREEFEGGLGKMKGKGEKRRKKKRVIKHMLKYLYEA